MTQYKRQYDSGVFYPAAPVINATIINSQKEGLLTSDFFLLDSGADISLITDEVFSILELITLDTISLNSFEDSNSMNPPKEYPLTEIMLEIPELKFRESIKVVAVDGRDNILGRDFMNKFEIFLDGINEEFTIQQ